VCRERRWDIALAWRDDDTHLPYDSPDQAFGSYDQTVVPERETTRGRYFETHMPSTIENTDLYSGKPRAFLALLHHCVRFVTDLPFHRDGLFMSLLERETIGQGRPHLTVT
jgi:hypothetical protein